ncbi:MAG: sulfatase [Thermoplasmata archaeon]|nr:sulfatase [Thermoplasmata archaeon]
MDYPNIFFIVFDTLRKDILPLYGGDSITPNLLEFSKDSAVFENPVAPSPWTVPSHMSFFSGLYPREHNVHEDLNGDRDSFEKIYNFDGNTIIKKLKNFGYNTIGFSTNPWLSPASGFDRNYNSFTFFSSEYIPPEELNAVDEYKKYGKNRYQAAINLIIHGKYKEFKKYYDIHKRILKRKEEMNYPYMKGSDLIVSSIENSSYEEPFFMFMNFMEVHEPVSKWELDQDDRKIKYLDLSGKKIIPENLMNETRRDYKIAMNKLDEQFGRFIKFLKKSKMYEKSLIIVLSDHGQAMKEKRNFPYYGHGNFLYNEIIEIPLIVKFPGNRKIEIKKGYQSLTSIPRLIENVIDGNIQDAITEEIAFSESFGPVHDLIGLTKSGILPKEINAEEMIKKMFYPKKAIYKNGYKLVINGSTGGIDEFSYNGKEAEPKKEILDDLKNELEIFKGNEKFVI